MTARERVEKALLKAKAATPGPWAVEDSECVITTVEQDSIDNPFPVVACTSTLCLGNDRPFEDADHIAQMDPYFAAALLERYLTMLDALDLIQDTMPNCNCMDTKKIAQTALASARAKLEVGGE